MNDILLAIVRHKGKATLFFGFVMAAVILLTLLLPKKYHSEGKLYLRLGRENATLDPTATLGEQAIVAIPQSRENEINSVVEVLKSRMLLEKAIDKLGPAAVLEVNETAVSAEGDKSNLPESKHHSLAGNIINSIKTLIGWPLMTERERALRQIVKNLSIEPVRRSNVIEISYEGGDPKAAQAVVATVIESYLDEHARLNRPQGSHDFFVEQTQRLRDNLTQKEAALRDLKTQTGLASTHDQRQQLITRIGRLEDDLLQTDAARAVSAAIVQMLRKKLAEFPVTQMTQEVSGYGNEGTDRMRDQFYALQVREKEAASKFTPVHPKYQQIYEQVERAKGVLADEQRTRTQVTKEPGRLYQQTQLELLAEEPIWASLDARTRELRVQLASARDELKSFNVNELRIAELQREVDLLDAEYRKYSASLEQAHIDQALELEHMSNINIVQKATFEPLPVSPRPLLNLLLGLGVGLFGVMGLCLVCERVGRSSNAPEEVEKKPTISILSALRRLSAKQLTGNGSR